ncbi:MAG: hypothetical protein RJB65_1348 [Actinomycetota bacterium]
MTRRQASDELLLGEWACLGLLALGPAHGFALASRLRPEGDVGRVWSLSRALTYRALEQLQVRGLIVAAGEEQGIAGGTRTLFTPTDDGRSELRRWLDAPVAHLRDLRSELLLKLVLARLNGVRTTALVRRQREVVARMVAVTDAAIIETPDDVVALWRAESARAAQRFLESLPS